MRRFNTCTWYILRTSSTVLSICRAKIESIRAGIMMLGAFLEFLLSCRPAFWGHDALLFHQQNDDDDKPHGTEVHSTRIQRQDSLGQARPCSLPSQAEGSPLEYRSQDFHPSHFCEKATSQCLSHCFSTAFRLLWRNTTSSLLFTITPIPRRFPCPPCRWINPGHTYASHDR